MLAAWAIFAGLLLPSLYVSDFISGDYGSAPLARIGAFLIRMNPHLEAEHLFAARDAQGSLAYWFYNVPQWARSLLTSLEMAFVATLTGSAMAALFSLVMAKTVTSSLALRLTARRSADVLRTLPDFILALLLVQAFGVGAPAGVVALTVTSFAGLARPFAEAIENCDPRPMECVRAAGGRGVHQIRFGLLPLVAPNMISLSFVVFEINVARSAALGIVGAGGIGTDLAAALALNQLDTYLALILMIVVVVMLADMASEQFRHRLFSSEHRQ